MKKNKDAPSASQPTDATAAPSSQSDGQAQSPKTPRPRKRRASTTRPSPGMSGTLSTSDVETSSPSESSRLDPLNPPLTRPSGTLSPSEGEREGVRGSTPIPSAPASQSHDTERLRLDEERIRLAESNAASLNLMEDAILARDRAEQVSTALRENERRLSALLGNLPGMAYRCRNDRDWTMEFVSEGCLALTGYTAEQLTSACDFNYADVIHPQDREAVWNDVQKALEKKEKFELRYRIYDASGLTKWVWEQGVGVFAADGALLALEGFILDVTKQHDAEALLAKYQILSDQARDIILFVDPQDGRIVEANQAAVATYGYNRSVLIGMNIRDLRSEDARLRVKEDMFVAATDGILFETCHQTRDGRVFPVEVSSRLAEVSAKPMLLSVIRDITLRKQSEAALLAREEQLKLALEAGRAITFEWDVPTDSIRYSSNAADLSRGEDQTPFTSRLSLSERIHPADREMTDEAFRRTRDEGALFECTHRVRLLDESYHWVIAKGKPTVAHDGKVERVSGVLVDITEQYQRQAVTAARERLLNMAATMPLDALLQATADEAEAITDSTIGFFHFLQPDQTTITLQAWSTNTTKNMCRAEIGSRHYPLDQAGVWADCVRQSGPVIYNDYDSLPNRKGMPEGHAAVTRQLAVPVKRDGKIVAILGVGNKATDYAGTDLASVSAIADLAWDITERKRIADELVALNQTLEKRVEERSAELFESEERYKIIFDTTLDAIITADASGKCINCNPAAVRMFGYRDREAMLGLGLQELSAARQLDERNASEFIAEKIGRVDSGESQSLSFEWLGKRADGSVFSAEVAIGTAEVKGQRFFHGIIRDTSERTLAEHRLRASEAKHRDLVNTIPDWVWEVDANGKYTFSGPQAKKLLGYETNEILGLSPFDLFYSEEEARRMAAYLAPIMAEGLPVVALPNTLRHKDGHPVIVESNSVPVRDASGKVCGYRGLDHDITARRRAEEALQASEKRFAAFMANIPAAAFVKDESGAILYANQYLQKLFNLRDDWQNRTTTEVIAGAQAVRMSDDDIKALRQGPLKVTEIVTDASGNPRTFETIKFPIRFESGPTILGGISIDVTERRLAEEALLESEAKFRSIVNSSPMAMYFYRLEADNRLVLIGANPAADKTIGIPHGRLVGKSIEEAFPNLAGTEVPEMYRKVASGQLGSQSFEIPYQDERFSGTYTVNVFKTGRRSIAVSFFDITERHQAEEKIRASEARFRSLVNSMSEGLALHEIVFGPDGKPVDYRLVDVNPAYERILGLRAEDVRGRPGSAVYGTPVAPYLESFTNVGITGKSDQMETWFTPMGKCFHITVFSPAKNQFATVFDDITERKRAEETLAASEERYRLIFDNAAFSIYILDSHGMILATNRMAQERMGYTADEFLSMSINQVNSPAEAVKVPGRIEKLMARGSNSFETVHRRKDGTLFPVEVSLQRITWNGLPAMMGFVRDLTERLEAEEALRTSEHRFRSLYNSMSEGLALYEVIYNQDGKPSDYKFVGVNPAFETMIGFKAEQVVGRPASAVYGTHAPPYLEAFTNVGITGQSTRLDAWFGATGRFFHINVFSPSSNQFATVFEDATDRMRAEEALRENEEKYRLLFENASDSILIVGEQGGILAANRLAESRLGYTHEEMLKLSLSDLDTPEQAVFIPERMSQLREQTQITFETRHRCKDGSDFPVEVSAQLTWWNKKAGVMAICRDLTERRRAEEALRESEGKLRVIYETSRDAIITIDADGDCLDCNPAAARMFGLADKQALLGKGYAHFTPPVQPDGRDTKEAFGQMITESMTRGSYTWEIYQRRANGTVFPVEASISVGEINGKPVLHGIGRDISERKLAEAELLKLKSAVEQSPVVVVITDSLGIIEYVNPSFETQTGYTLAEVIGKKPNLLKSGVQTPEFYQELWDRLHEGQTWRGEICNKRKDGSYFWEIAAIAPLRDKSGHVTHFVAIKEDITERRRIAEELRQAKEAAEAASVSKGMFLANMSHEIRTPLNAIIGFVQVMQQDKGLPAQHLKYLDTISKGGEHLLSLLSTILDLSKIELGRMELSIAECDFLALLYELDNMFRWLAEDKGLTFEIERATPLPQGLKTDVLRLRQVLFNLLNNAVKFTAQGSIRLRVSSEPAPATAAGKPAEKIIFEVRDTGPGIGEDEFHKLFSPFDQTATGRRKGGGSGLGLAISQRLARMLGGGITAASKVGEGSTFTLTIEAEVVASAETTSAEPSADAVLRLKPGPNPPRVLVVDDIQANRELLCTILQAAGFAVSQATGGAESVAICKQEQPAIVLMDRRMPGVDGIDATRLIRADAPGAGPKILIISADVFGTPDKEWREAGADGFIAKPFNNTKLLTKIGSLLGLEYTHEDAPPVAQIASAAVSALAIASLPEELRAKLIHATEVGDSATLKKIIAEEVLPKHAEAGETLRRLAESYAYDAILRTLQNKLSEQ